MPKILGYKGWTEAHQKGFCISLKPWTEDKSYKQLHPTDEPFAVVLFLNHRERYINQCAWFMAGNTKLPRKGEQGYDEAKYKCSRYTNAKGGWQKYGGWTDDGVKKFNELVQLYCTAKYETPEPDKIATSAIKKGFLEWEEKVRVLIKKHYDGDKVAAAAATGAAAPDEDAKMPANPPVKAITFSM